jgi:hypothetical protein
VAAVLVSVNISIINKRTLSVIKKWPWFPTVPLQSDSLLHCNRVYNLPTTDYQWWYNGSVQMLKWAVKMTYSSRRYLIRQLMPQENSRKLRTHLVWQWCSIPFQQRTFLEHYSNSINTEPASNICFVSKFQQKESLLHNYCDLVWFPFVSF